MIIAIGEQYTTILVAKYSDDGTSTGRLLSEAGEYIVSDDGSRFLIEQTGEDATAEAPSVVAVSESGDVLSVTESNPVVAVNESLIVVSAPQEVKVISVALGGGSGGGDTYLTWVEKTGAYTLAAGDGVLADTSGGAFSVTLPPSPSAGDTVGINDSLSNFATANLTVARNGENIHGIADDLICDIDFASFVLIYTGTTNGWMLDTYFAG